MSTCDSLLERISVAGFDGEVWSTRFDTVTRHVPRLARLLAPGELARAARLRSRRDRRRFVAGRAGLRVLLGRRLGIAPEAVVFAYGKRGKPCLPGRPGHIHFNVSHSNERALYALSSRGPVGIDIEYLHRDLPWRRLARRFFSARESAALERLAEVHGKNAFFACWTRKEAVAKALGEGLSLPLHAIEVTVEPDSPPHLLAAPDEIAADWALYSPGVGPDYVATVATFRGNRG